jgi:tellurite resistance protein TehA-like permease
MNEQTAKLIEELANKLGTTAEHLWGVLIRQAPITATTDLLLLVAACIGLIIIARVLPKVVRKFEEGDEGIGDLFIIIASIIFGILCLIILVLSLCELGTTLSGFFNPEYWALKQILH